MKPPRLLMIVAAILLILVLVQCVHAEEKIKRNDPR